MKEQNDRNSRVVGYLRKRLYLPEDLFSDSFILRETEGTFSRALVELHVALVDLRSVMRKELPRWLRWMI